VTTSPFSHRWRGVSRSIKVLPTAAWLLAGTLCPATAGQPAPGPSPSPGAAAGSAVAGPDFRPPGDLVQVGPETLHLVCVGSGEPTVLLESGLGGNYLDWTFVQPLLAGSVRACSYDRAGMGFSAPAVRPRTLANLTSDLEALLLAAHVDGPVVMAGHSFGGVLALHFARLHPERVKGLVLVDSMHPDQFARFAEAGAEVSQDPNLVLGRTHPAAAAYGLPDVLQGRAIWLATEPKSRKAVIGEMRAMADSLGQVVAAGYPRVAARVLEHGDGEWNQVYGDGRMERAWSAMQADLAAQVGAPPPLRVAGASHQIPLDAPQVVAAVIEMLVAKAR
jgi:pimeloyl-ACP methyl ester carboxylesterase